MEAYDLSQITAADFKVINGQPVEIHFAANFSLPATVGGITELNGYTPLERGSFSVEFQTQGEHQVFEQGIFKVVRPDGKHLEIFLVPIAQHPLGTRYEAVFS